ncbi:DUF1631 domain-containing protein [soil metagenome]
MSVHGFTTQSQASARAQGADPVRLLADLKRIAVEQLATVPGGLYEPIEAQLNDALRLGTSLAPRNDLQTVLAMRQRNATYLMRYRELVARGFDDFHHPAGGVPSELPLDLVGEKELGFQLDGQRLAESIARRYQRPLELLERRLGALAEALGVSAGSNPVGPGQLTAVFLRTFGEAHVSDTLQPLLFRHYDQELGKVLGDLYQRLNGRLAVNGFLADPRTAEPAATSAVGPVPAGGPAPVGFTGAAAAGGNPAVSEAALERHRQLCTLIHARRRSGGSAQAQPRSAPGGESAQAPIRHMRASELASVASLLQRESHAELEQALDSDASLSEALRERLLDGARRLGLDPDLAPLGAPEADAIDLVGLVLEAMVEAHALASEGRRLFARLALPLVKVALADEHLFLDAAHPARRFVDALALSCEDHDPESPQAGALMNSAERAVERVIAGYNEDLAVFDLATSELQDLMEQQRQRAEIVERRSVDTVHGRERLLQARLQAATALAQRASGLRLSPTVYGFLEAHWSHHLVQVLLREGAEAGRYAQALGLADELVAIDQAAARCERADVVRRVVAIRPALVECLSSAGLDADATNEWMAGLARTLAFPDGARQERTLPAMPRMADDSDDTRLLQVVGGSGLPPANPQDIERMRGLVPGAWLRLVDETGEEGAVKLAWISPLTSRLLLVNRRGVRKLVASPEQLAVLVALGRLSLEADHMPFDEALRQLSRRLGGPAMAA